MHTKNQVRRGNRTQSMCDYNGRTILRKFVQGGLDLALGGGVEGRSGFVEHYYFGVFEDCAGYGDALTFAAGETQAAFADTGAVAVRESEDSIMDLGCPCCVVNLCHQSFKI